MSVAQLYFGSQNEDCRHNGCQLNEKDLPLANMGYTVENTIHYGAEP